MNATDTLKAAGIALGEEMAIGADCVVCSTDTPYVAVMTNAKYKGVWYAHIGLLEGQYSADTCEVYLVEKLVPVEDGEAIRSPLYRGCLEFNGRPLSYLRAYMGKNRLLQSLASFARKYPEFCHLRIDIHPENIMRTRTAKYLVLTDPFIGDSAADVDARERFTLARLGIAD